MIQKREKVKCPVCSSKFIPKSFHFEKTSFDQVLTRGELIEFPNGKHQLELKPFTSFRGAFVTYCPECGYLIKFVAEIGSKEIIEDPSRIQKLSAIKEFGNKYKYKFDLNEKPYMDYTDYFIEKVDNIKKSIKNALDGIQFDQWGNSYRKWKEDKSVDSFKFLIHFYSTLIDYLDSEIEDEYNNKSVVQKIEELNLPKNLEILTKDVNQLRNKVTHEIYELSEEEEILVETTFTQFTQYLIKKQLSQLNLNKIKIKPDYDFIDINKVKYEIQEFLHIYLENVLPIKGLFNQFLIPLFEDLGVRTPYYNP